MGKIRKVKGTGKLNFQEMRTLLLLKKKFGVSNQYSEIPEKINAVIKSQKWSKDAIRIEFHNLGTTVRGVNSIFKKINGKRLAFNFFASPASSSNDRADSLFDNLEELILVSH